MIQNLVMDSLVPHSAFIHIFVCWMHLDPIERSISSNEKQASLRSVTFVIKKVPSDATPRGSMRHLNSACSRPTPADFFSVPIYLPRSHSRVRCRTYLPFFVTWAHSGGEAHAVQLPSVPGRSSRFVRAPRTTWRVLFHLRCLHVFCWSYLWSFLSLLWVGGIGLPFAKVKIVEN